MKKELVLLLAALAVVVVACGVPAEPKGTAPVSEAPDQVKAPTPTPEAPALEEQTTDGCQDACATQCDEDADTACSKATDYDECVANCGDIIRSEGCKGACATGVPIECGIIFRNECGEACMTKCA
ncbi:hypothetical protein HY493_02885 [Candidatus Woesearchaeota archaeon]|nr:hypothetical protein [Candidatus Woesearchaeota archaeon]